MGYDILLRTKYSQSENYSVNRVNNIFFPDENTFALKLAPDKC